MSEQTEAREVVVPELNTMQLEQGNSWTDDDGVVHCDFLWCRFYDQDGEYLRKKHMLDLTAAEKILLKTQQAQRKENVLRAKRIEDLVVFLQRKLDNQSILLDDAPSVYFIASTNYVKVGVASNPQNRLRDIQTACPLELELLATFPGGYVLEAILHKVIDRHRVRGEWFKRTEKVVEIIDAAAALLTESGEAND